MAHINPHNPLQFIVVKHNGKFEWILPEEIYFIQGSGKTAKFYTADPLGQKPFRVLTDGHNLGHYRNLLDHGFLAVNQSFMVNQRHILRIEEDKSVALRHTFEHAPISFSKNCYTKFMALRKQR